MPKIVKIDPDKLRHLYVEKKMACKDVAEILDVSPATVWKHLKKHGIPVRDISEAHKGQTPANCVRPPDKEIWLAYEKGGAKYIANTYSVSLCTAYEWMKKCGIKYQPTPHAVSPPNAEALQKHLNDGLSLNKIAELYKVKRPTVAKWLNLAGIEYDSKPHRYKNGFTKEDVIELYFNQGLPLYTVAEKLNTTRIVLRARCKEWGIDINPRPHKIDFLTEDYLMETYVNGELSGQDIADKLGIHPTTVYAYLSQHGIKARDAGYTSSPENQIRSLLENHGLVVTKRKLRKKNGKHFELDLVCEDRKIAIEYCGLYWHSEHPSHGLDRSCRYHIDKMKVCQDFGWQLITIFEDEFVQRRKQVEAILLAKFGIFDRRLYAKQCTVTEIDTSAASNFCDEHHLQGGAYMKRAFGLFKDDELLGVMSFSHHHRQFDELVLNRLCFKNGVQIIGGANRLLSFARKHIQEPIVTWSDNRWSTGDVYEKMGFRLDREYGPDYSYTNGRQPPQRRSKQNMRKSVTGCPKDVKEHVWCAEQGWYRIWDCGKKRWVLE